MGRAAHKHAGSGPSADGRSGDGSPGDAGRDAIADGRDAGVLDKRAADRRADCPFGTASGDGHPDSRTATDRRPAADLGRSADRWTSS